MSQLSLPYGVLITSTWRSMFLMSCEFFCIMLRSEQSKPIFLYRWTMVWINHHAIKQRNTSFSVSNCKIVVFCKTKIWTICIICLRYIQSQYTCHIFPTSTFIYVQQIMTERYIELDLVSKLTLWQKKKHGTKPSRFLCIVENLQNCFVRKLF